MHLAPYASIQRTPSATIADHVRNTIPLGCNEEFEAAVLARAVDHISERVDGLMVRTVLFADGSTVRLASKAEAPDHDMPPAGCSWVDATSFQ